MAVEYRAGQGSIVPSLFIGLGGEGSRIVDRIAAHAQRLPNWESQLRSLTSFVSVDTNIGDQHELHNIPIGNRLNIAAFDKGSAVEGYRRSRNNQVLQWLDEAYQPREGSSNPGAGQIRVESRMGFYFHSLDIRQRLHELIKETLEPNNTWRQSKPLQYDVYIFCSLAGGTGSGSFLCMAYLVSALLKNEHKWEPHVFGHLILSTLMLDKVGKELHPDIHANTYAALKELEHLTKLDYDEVIKAGRTSEPFVYCRNQNNTEVTHVNSRPFFLSFIYDRPAHHELRDPTAAIADTAFLQIFTPVTTHLRGEYDNYVKNTKGLTKFPGELKNIGQGYSKNFGACGAVALMLPADDLLEYSALRFAAQAIRSQITFGVDPNAPTDDRAIALARLAVRYDDEKFLNLGDEGRQRRINEAFLESVQEMARQDAAQELDEGYWRQLVERIDEGLVTGHDDKGNVVRSESLRASVARKLAEERQPLLNKISVRVRAFVFHKEGINQYSDIIGKLKEDISRARQMEDEGAKGLASAAKEGAQVTGLRLDPLAERYLVLRMLEACNQNLIPDAERQINDALQRDLSNPKVAERLEREFPELLREAAASRRLLNRDQAFLDVRDEAQRFAETVAAAVQKTADARLRLGQLRNLREFLDTRSRQYAALATRMDGLVTDIEREAEALRRGERVLSPRFALAVEIFETLDEPRTRLWDAVYRELYIDRGRYLTTFDRRQLAEAIAEQLKPKQHQGRVVSKSIEEMVNGMRQSLCDIGRERLRTAIFGDDVRSGLDIPRGLELEAQVVLSRGRSPESEISQHEIDSYVQKKLLSLAQMCGVLARVRTSEAQANDEGVIVNRTRQLIIGTNNQTPSATNFIEKLKNALSMHGRQVKLAPWYHSHLAVVHDVELPIPLYYIQPISDEHEIEGAYMQVAATEQRGYNLHTDFHWEKSLPNLNPRKSELVVGWSLRTLAEGLLTRVLTLRDGVFHWQMDDESGKVRQFGTSFASALYRLGELHRIEDLRRKLERQMRDKAQEQTPEYRAERQKQLTKSVRDLLEKIGEAEADGNLSRDDELDRRILKTIEVLLESAEPGAERSASTAGKQGRTFD